MIERFLFFSFFSLGLSVDQRVIYDFMLDLGLVYDIGQESRTFHY